MSYRTATPAERAQDALTLRVLACITATAAKQAMADALLIRSKVVQGEDGTLRVIC